MAKKIDDIFKDLNSYIDKIEDSIDERVAAGIAYTVRQRMLSLISKGISPILGWGRFPEYIGAANKRALREDLKRLKKSNKFIRNQLTTRGLNNRLSRIQKNIGASEARSRRKNLSIERAFRAKEFKSQKQDLKNKINRVRYPYSVQDEFPNKRPRPVNLFLSGDFLSNLTYALGRAGKKQLITIGFFDELSKKKESGHRVGVNGQPKRPIIPNATESFSQIIKVDILKIMKDVIKRASKR